MTEGVCHHPPGVLACPSCYFFKRVGPDVCHPSSDHRKPLTPWTALSAARRKRGLSQYRLAELVGVTQDAISKWESGRPVPPQMIRRLAAALEVGVGLLLA